MVTVCLNNGCYLSANLMQSRTQKLLLSSFIVRNFDRSRTHERKSKQNLLNNVALDQHILNFDSLCNTFQMKDSARPVKTEIETCSYGFKNDVNEHVYKRNVSDVYNISFNPLVQSFRFLHYKKDASNKPKTEKKEPETRTKNPKFDGTPLVMVFYENDPVQTMTLIHAERLAKRRSLKLVKVEDPNIKGNFAHQVYKLMTGRQFYEEDLRARQSSKLKAVVKIEEKMITVSGKIGENDILSKFGRLHKWLDRGCQVRVTIAGHYSSSEEQKGVMKIIENEVKKQSARILQLREKMGDIKFTIDRPKSSKSELLQEPETLNSLDSETDTPSDSQNAEKDE